MSDSAHDLDAPSKTDPVNEPPTEHGPAAGEDAGLSTPGPTSDQKPDQPTAGEAETSPPKDAGVSGAGASTEPAGQPAPPHQEPTQEPDQKPDQEPDQEPDLEMQVESLLAEVTQTVEEIQTKLGDTEPEAQTTPEPEPAPAAEEPSDEPDAPTDAESVQEALQAAIADEPTAEASPDEPADVTPESITEELTPPQAVPSSDADPDAAEPGTPIDEEDAADEPNNDPDPGYGGSATLDDELAALASHALDEDLDASFDDGPTSEPQTEAAPAASTDAAASTEPDAAPAEQPAPAAQAAVQPAAQTDAPTGATDTPASPEPAGPLRWGWLPPKPEWPQCYSRLRPVVIAWRHAVWVVPPLLRHLFRLAAPHARRAEPKVRHAVAVAAAPLSKRDRRTRSAIGWLACNTLFWGACLWVWIFWARSPAVPELTSPPTALQSASELQAAADTPD